MDTNDTNGTRLSVSGMRRYAACGYAYKLHVRHEVALNKWSEMEALTQASVQACSQSCHALLATGVCEAQGKDYGAADPSRRTGLGKEWMGECK